VLDALSYSLIIPVFNRPDEVEELLQSLSQQTLSDFEVLIVEDGSSIPCKEVCNRFSDRLNIRYLPKTNSGPGNSRNYGMACATGNYFIIFDSDCVIPPQYMQAVHTRLSIDYADCFGGPDAAHEKFTDLQKAINHTMTSVFTTGGIRGGSERLGKFQPRSFNMGISREVFERVGGYGDLHPGEDPDLSFRIWAAGFKTALIKDAYVWHKRRIDFEKFGKQVYKFGVVRVILNKWHRGTSKLTYWFPTLFLFGIAGCLLMSFRNFIFIAFPLGYFLLVAADALRKTGRIKIALLTFPALWIQFYGYGRGFLEAQIKLNVLGYPERKAFAGFFFDKTK
jgi:glycosyltransferase involved in cell wall biosynthesis